MDYSSHETTSPTTAALILCTLLMFVGGHALLSQFGLIPSEVSIVNQEVQKAATRLHKITYERSPEKTIESTESVRSLPEPPQSVDTTNLGQDPKRITIESIDVSAPVMNPNETNISVLDSALKEGVVHYPGSGGVGGDRAMFLFGHSSRLPVVQNDAYRSFNGLEKLSVGDTITVEGANTSETYAVMSVRVVDKGEALVDFSEGENMLILSTCSTFGSKENRVVVKARQKYR